MNPAPLFHRSSELMDNFCKVCRADVQDVEGSCLACGHRVWFEWEHSAERISVRLGGLGIVTEQNIMRTFARLEHAIRVGDCREVTIDFGPVTHLTSTAVGHLVILKRRLDAVGGKTSLRVARAELLDIFRITRLDAVFPIEVQTAAELSPARR